MNQQFYKNMALWVVILVVSHGIADARPNRERVGGFDAADARITWPNGARVALWVIPTVEWFPLDMTSTPFKVPGGIERPYPDYWTYTLRDYGTRNGIYRIFRVLDDLGIKASVAPTCRNPA